MSETKDNETKKTPETTPTFNYKEDKTNRMFA